MKIFSVGVWGDFACFTRPEAKVERFSYQVMTPSAARGILDAIYSKPVEFGWRIKSISVINPIQYIGLRRNEVKDKLSMSAIVKAASGGEAPVIIADGTRELLGTDAAGRTQRQTMALKNVRYVINAFIKPRNGLERQLPAFEAQADRRINTGKCYYQPFMGCREFAAYFEPDAAEHKSINVNEDLGWMVYDVFDLEQVVIDSAKPFVSLFWGRLENGVLKVPDWESDLVKKPNRR